MIDARELIDRVSPERSLVALPSLSPEGDWTLGYQDVARAARAFARGTAFLSRHWEELDADTRGSLLRSIEATAHDVNRLLGGYTVKETALLDEALAARVGSF
jgi:hypothetical protein